MSFQDICPVCGSPDFEYDDTSVIDDCLIQTCSCPDCDSTWEEVWAFVENRNIVDHRQSEPDIIDQKTLDVIKAWQ